MFFSSNCLLIITFNLNDELSCVIFSNAVCDASVHNGHRSAADRRAHLGESFADLSQGSPEI